MLLGHADVMEGCWTRAHRGAGPASVTSTERIWTPDGVYTGWTANRMTHSSEELGFEKEDKK